MLAMILPDPPFPLAHLTEFKVGETFGVSAHVDEDDTCYESGDVSIEVHDLDATFARRPYMGTKVIVPISPDLTNHTSPNHLDTFHAFPFSTLPFC